MAQHRGGCRLVDVRLLGPVELRGARTRADLGTPRQRCVLAVLAMTPGQPVGLATLVDRVWGEQAPRNARDSLYSHISRLRSQVRACGGSLLRRDGGYVLEVDADAVDLHRVRRLVGEARAAASDDDDEQAAHLLRRACELWRGVPLAGVSGDWAERVRTGLGQERLALLTERFEVDLRRGQHAEIVGPLAEAQAEYPLAEPLAGLLMLALYRTGRHSEALTVYSRTRQDLISEIGDEPAPWLQELHGQMLRRDPDLALPLAPPAAAPARAASGGVSPPPRPVPAQLPPDIAGFSGRARELAELDALLPIPSSDAPVVVAVEGTAGVGKSALVVRWAHRMRRQFPDGQLHADLRGFALGAPSTPGEVIARFLHSLGVPAERVPADLDEAVGLYRSLLADRRMLIVLDNAVDPDQVRVLLPSGAGSMALVTGRDQLAGLAVRDGAHRMVLDVLSEAESVALLTGLLGAERVSAEPPAVSELAALCGHLPLALRVVAANLAGRPHLSIGDYSARLRASDRVRALAVSGDVHSAVPAAFDLSYLRLPPPARRMFRLLGLAPGADVEVGAAAALAHLPAEQTSGLLEELAGAHLVEERAPGRFGCHDLLHQYAAARAAEEDSAQARQAALTRLFDHYLRIADAAVHAVNPVIVRLPLPRHGGDPPTFHDSGTAIAWLDTERANLVAATAHAADHGLYCVAVSLADVLRGYFVLSPYMDDWQRVAEAAAAAAVAAGDRRWLAAARLNLAHVALRRSRYRTAITHASDGLSDATCAGWREAEGALQNLLGSACLPLGELPAALDHFASSIAVFEQLGWKHAVAALHGNLARVNSNLGRFAAAADCARRGLVETRELDVPIGEVINLEVLGEVYRAQGDLAAAVEMLTAARELAATVGFRSAEGDALLELAYVHSEVGDHAGARELAATALAMARSHSLRHLEAQALNVVARLDRDAAGLREALRLSRQTADRYPETSALIGLAQVLLAQGDEAGARASAEQAVQIARAAGYRRQEASGLLTLAAVCRSGQASPDAITYAEAALAGFRAVGDPLGQVRSLLMLARAVEAAGGQRRAQGHRRTAMTLLGTVRMPGDWGCPGLLAGTEAEPLLAG